MKKIISPINRKPCHSYNTVINRITLAIRFEFKKVRVNAMISFDDFNMGDGSPIYMQILLYIKRGVVAGSIRDGDELPSRRVLSSLLGVNPNTVQKAYRLLEDENLISSHSDAKSFMVLDEVNKERVRAELLENDAVSVVSAMRQMGVSKAEALALIEKYWE